MRPVTIDGSQSGIGAGAGAITGGIAGSTVGGGSGSAVATILGAVVGGVVGNAVERGTTQQNGVEILVQLRNGERRSIIQASTSDNWAVGEPVVLVTTGGRARVTRAPQAYQPAPDGYPAPPPAYPSVGPGSAAELKRLAERVEQRSADLGPGRPAGLGVTLVHLQLDADVVARRVPAPQRLRHAVALADVGIVPAQPQ